MFVTTALNKLNLNSLALVEAVISLYWIRHKDHTDPYTQGYIGISTRLEKRWREHQRCIENNNPKQLFHRLAIKAGGWDDLVCEILDETDNAGSHEYVYRQRWYIGWNEAPGGDSTIQAVREYHRRIKPHRLICLWKKLLSYL
jgi:hypothetical protein